MWFWKITPHNGAAFRVEAENLEMAMSMARKTLGSTDIRSIVCLSESATKRAIYQQRLGNVSDHVWAGYREAERLLVFVTEQFPEATQAKAADLLRALKQAGNIISEIHSDQPKN